MEKCEFCNHEIKEADHLLGCEMVLAHFFGPSTTLVCQEDVNISLITTIKKPNKLPTPRWKTIRELCNDLRGISTTPNNMMYM